MPLEELFFQIAFVIALAALFSFLAHRLRQPLIIAYILTGVVAGPSALALARSGSVFATLGQIGVAFLLFTVGLGLNWRRVKDVGGIAVVSGVGQVVLTSLAAFAVAHFLGYDARTALYLAAALTFSSTIIIVKLLTDKEEIDSLYGRLAVGILLVQDFIAMFLLLGLSAFGHGASVSDVLTWSLLKVVLLIPILWLVAAKFLPYVVGYAAKSQELLFIFAVAWCFLVAGGLTFLGFSVELGALLAGITLASTAFAQEIQGKLRPLRDFFLVIFFIVLGTQLSFVSFRAAIVPILVFSAFVLLLKPLLVVPVMRALGEHPRTAFLVGTTSAQVSEFSFILVAAAIALGHVAPDVLSVVTAVGLVSIAGSSYFVLHNEGMYAALRPLFRWMEPARVKRPRGKRQPALQVVMFGLHRVGGPSLETLHELGLPYAVVDYDPQVVRELSAQGEPVIYGDVTDEIFLADFGVQHVPLIISTIPDASVSLALLAFLRSRRASSTVVVAARDAATAAECYAAGAAYVIVPNVLGGEKFRELLEHTRTRAAAWRLLGRRERRILGQYDDRA